MRFLTLLAVCSALVAPRAAFAQVHEIDTVGIDVSPFPGQPPDGVAEFYADAELLGVEYEGQPAGTSVTTTHYATEMWPHPHHRYWVYVRNESGDTIRNAVLTIENYGFFFGDPTGWIFLYETVWDPPAMAGGEIPAYPLGDLAPGQQKMVDVKMLIGFELPIFDGAFDANSLGFDSSESIPAFSDASVLLHAENPGDLDGDGMVGVNDFLALIAQWGACPQPCPPSCSGDLDGDCEVGLNDFLMLLDHWD